MTASKHTKKLRCKERNNQPAFFDTKQYDHTVLSNKANNISNKVCEKLLDPGGAQINVEIFRGGLCPPVECYSMMYNEDIASISVKNLLSPDSIVAVWCTNAPSNISAVKDLIFPAWGIEYVATWYWLKVTTSLQPLCDFGTGSQKQPYERIILGKLGDVGEVPSERLVVSIPSALHSHKPPLIDLLSPYLNEKPTTLELFARYLLPNTTSIGYEPLKWQHLSLYEDIR